MEILIIGAGVVGLASAYELAERGASVRVLEARDLTSGATWASAGILAPYTNPIPSPELEAFCIESLTRYPAFAATLLERTGIDVDLRLSGSIQSIFDDRTFSTVAEHTAALSARGLRARLLDPV